MGVCACAFGLIEEIKLKLPSGFCHTFSLEVALIDRHHEVWGSQIRPGTCQTDLVTPSVRGSTKPVSGNYLCWLGLVVLCIILPVYQTSIWNTYTQPQVGGSPSVLNPPTYTLYGYVFESLVSGIHPSAYELMMGAFLWPCVFYHISRFVFSRHVAKKSPRGQLAMWNDHRPVGAGPLHYCDGGLAWGGQEG